MDIVLVDTSVWINFFKGKETDASLYLKNNLSNLIIATCPVIVQEVLQGIANDKEFNLIADYFNNFIQLVEDQYELAHSAAKLYRDLRKRGVSIRKPNDCLIAGYAMKNDLILLNDDKDFREIARHASLKTINFN